MGGLGFPRLPDDINTTKYSIFQRHQHAGGLITSNIDTLLYNGVIQPSQVPVSSTGVTVYAQPKLSSKCWANSLIQYAKEGDLYLCRQGSSLYHTPASPIISTSLPESQPKPWGLFLTSTYPSLATCTRLSLAPPWSGTTLATPYVRTYSGTPSGNPPYSPVPLRSNQFRLPSRDTNYPLDMIV